MESNGPKVVAQIEQPGPHRSFRRPTGRRQHLLVVRAPATTAEHKFKQTDLRRMKGDDDFLYTTAKATMAGSAASTAQREACEVPQESLWTLQQLQESAL